MIVRATKDSKELFSKTLNADFIVDPCIDIEEPQGGVKSSVCGESLEFTLKGGALANDIVSSMGLECDFKAAVQDGEDKSVTVPPEKASDGSIKCISPRALGSYLGWNFERLVLKMKDGTPLADHPIIPNNAQGDCIDIKPSDSSFCWRAEDPAHVRIYGDAVKNFLDAGVDLACVIDGVEIAAEMSSAANELMCALDDATLQIGRSVIDVRLILKSESVGDLKVKQEKLDIQTAFCGKLDTSSSGDASCMGSPIDAGLIVGTSARTLGSEDVECEFSFPQNNVTVREAATVDAEGRSRCILNDAKTVYQIIDDDGAVPSGSIAVIRKNVDLIRTNLAARDLKTQVSCAEFQFAEAPKCTEEPTSAVTSVSISGKSIDYAKKMSMKCTFVDNTGKVLAESDFDGGKCGTSSDLSSASLLKLAISHGVALQSISKPLDDISCPESGGGSAGAIIGGVAGVGLVAAALFLVYKRRERNRAQELKDREAVVSYVGDLTDQFPGKIRKCPSGIRGHPMAISVWTLSLRGVSMQLCTAMQAPAQS